MAQSWLWGSQVEIEKKQAKKFLILLMSGGNKRSYIPKQTGSYILEQFGAFSNLLLQPGIKGLKLASLKST